jgi:MiaB/RimO family radical SAM methylthiotransferase
LVAGAAAGVRQLCFDPGKVPLDLDVRPEVAGPTTYVKISEGCDRTCTFCAIPAIRGRHRSRDAKAISDEIRMLVDRGTKEVVLVAQDMSLYGRDLTGAWELPSLLRGLGDIDGLMWLRMLYQYPRYVDTELLDAVADSAPAVPYFDLSLQHASKRLVRKMKRWGDGDRFLEMIGKIRDRFGETALRSAFIVGFPGETEEEVEQLADFLREARLDWAGFFPYSREEGTEAASFTEGAVSGPVAFERAEALSAVQAEVAEAKRAELIGSTVEVMVEEREGIEIRGRTWREAPEVDAAVILDGLRGARVGDMVTATVTGTDGLDLVATA